jgi:hypothetical protein
MECSKANKRGPWEMNELEKRGSYKMSKKSQRKSHTWTRRVVESALMSMSVCVYHELEGMSPVEPKSMITAILKFKLRSCTRVPFPAISALLFTHVRFCELDFIGSTRFLF